MNTTKTADQLLEEGLRLIVQAMHQKAKRENNPVDAAAAGLAVSQLIEGLALDFKKQALEKAKEAAQ